MITGKTKKVGIMGWPVGHSMSPAMHNAAFAAAGLNYVYVPLAVEPGNLKEAVAGLKTLDFVGANVTIPHKVEIMQYLDEIDSTARRVGAVNTIVIKDGKSIGYNTDASGFVESLVHSNVQIKDRQAVLLGAGGAARAVVCGLIGAGISKLSIGVRNKQKAEVFAADFTNSVAIYDWQDQSFTETLATCDVLINCTPLGMSPNLEAMPPVVWESLKETAAVCDLIYNPQVTKFLETASLAGYFTMNGQGMLIGQGAVAFQLWTGIKPDFTVMQNVFNKV